MKDVLVVSLIDPSGFAVDISARIFWSSVGSISKSRESADELYAYQAGDWTFEADDRDALIRTLLRPDDTRTDRLNDLGKLFVIDARRRNTVTAALEFEFRGFILPKMVIYNPERKSVRVTALDPMRLVDNAYAGNVKRDFPPMVTTAPVLAGATTIPISVASVDIQPDDEVRVGGFDFIVDGMLNSAIQLRGPTSEAIGAGTVVTVITDFYRHRNIDDLVTKLFIEAGITDFDLRYSGIVSSRPFQSSINSGPKSGFAHGLDGFGALRGISAGTISVLLDTYVMAAAMQGNHQDGTNGIRIAPSQSSGWENMAASDVTRSVDLLAGGFDGAHRCGRGAGVFKVTAGAERRSQVQQVWRDHAIVSPTVLLPYFSVDQNAFTTVRPTGTSSTSYMYRLRLNQSIHHDESDLQDGYSVTLFRYVSTNAGQTWTLDTAFASAGQSILFSSVSADLPSDELLTQVSLDGFVPPSGGSGFDHVLYGTFWAGGTCRLRRWLISGNAILASADISTFAGPVRCGSKATYTQSVAGYSLLGATHHIDIYLLGSPAPGGHGLYHIQESFSGTTAQTTWVQGPMPVGSYSPEMRSLAWNGVDNDDSRIAFALNSPERGIGIAILRPGNTELSNEAGSFTAELVSIVAKDAVHAYSTKASSTAHLTGHRFEIAASAASSAASWYDSTGGRRVAQGPLLLAPWLITTGSSTETAWLLYADGKFSLFSKLHSGFIAKADFSGMTVADALTELGFLVNVRPWVTWESPGETLPFGIFVSRDLVDTEPAKLMENLDGSAVTGAAALIMRKPEYIRASPYNALYVSVIGETEDISAERGDPAFRKEGIEINSRFLESDDYADVIADVTFKQLGPAVRTYAGPGIAPNNTGSGTVAYVVAGYDTGGVVIGVTAESKITNAATPISGANPISVTWVPMVGADIYRVFRTQVYAGGQLGQVGGTIDADNPELTQDTSFLGLGLSAPSQLLPPRQEVSFPVRRDGTKYYPGRVIRMRDMFDRPDPYSPALPPEWIVEDVEGKLTSRTLQLRAIIKEAF